MFTRNKTIPIIFLFFITLSTSITTPHTSQADVTDPPQITACADSLTFEFNTTGNYFWWILVDDDPFRYQIYRNGLLGSDTYWQDGDNISRMINFNLPVGVYNNTLLASDMAGNTATSTIWITITDPASTSYSWSFLIA
ncbi:MAG: hypothetical protein ACTSU7_07220, partial [Candidatus Heimdallarchaeaceae archaeon]